MRGKEADVSDQACVELFGAVLHVKVWQHWQKKYTSHCARIERNSFCSLEKGSFSEKLPATVRPPSHRVKWFHWNQFTDCFGNRVPTGIWCPNELASIHSHLQTLAVLSFPMCFTSFLQYSHGYFKLCGRSVGECIYKVHIVPGLNCCETCHPDLSGVKRQLSFVMRTCYGSGGPPGPAGCDQLGSLMSPDSGCLQLSQRLSFLLIHLLSDQGNINSWNLEDLELLGLGS